MLIIINEIDVVFALDAHIFFVNGFMPVLMFLPEFISILTLPRLVEGAEHKSGMASSLSRPISKTTHRSDTRKGSNR